MRILLAIVMWVGCVGDAPEVDENGVHYEPWAAGQVVWPNATSHTNSDAWLREHHDSITLLKPKVLVLVGDNKATLDDVKHSVASFVAASAEASRYHGYSDASAKSELQYQVTYVDLRDNSTAPWSRAWPVNLVGGQPQFDPKGLFTVAFAQHIGIPNPNPDAHGSYYTLCELFEHGLINELWLSGPRVNGNPVGIYESVARVQTYDDAGKPIAGQFDGCAGNGCIDTGAAGQCKVSVRLVEVATSAGQPEERGVGCSLHATGHAMEGLARAIPPYRAMSTRFFNFDLDTRYGVAINSQYDRCPSNGNCYAYPDNHTLTTDLLGVSTAPAVRIEGWGEGCGNVHFPPNARGEYDYGNTAPVLSTCTSFGLHNSASGHDHEEAYTANVVANYETKYGDCGGGWQVYMRQSMPGHGTKATFDNGAPMKDWWPFLYY